MKPTRRVFQEIPLYSCPPPRRACKTANCGNDALSNGPYCDDCDSEIRWRYPEIWRRRTREFDGA